jgi:hypothetical protein
MVTGEAPVVDTTSTEVGSNFDTGRSGRSRRGAATRRSCSWRRASRRRTTNTGQFANTIAIYGSSGLENSFIIDGADTSGVEYGAQGKELNFEFIQEVDVKTGGYQAEYGRSTGGIINVITKSGGNEFHGDVFGYYNANSLQAGQPATPTRTSTGTNLGFSQVRLGPGRGRVHLEGPDLVLRRLRPRQEHHDHRALLGPVLGEEFDSPTVRNLGSGKLTLMVNASNTLVGTFFQDPGTTDRRHQRRRPHFERSSRRPSSAARSRRTGLGRSLQRDLWQLLGRQLPVRVAPGTQLREPGDGRGAGHPGSSTSSPRTSRPAASV